MKPLGESAFWIMAAGASWPLTALAEETQKAPGYSGSDYIWFTFIFGILAYGIYDTFLKAP